MRIITEHLPLRLPAPVQPSLIETGFGFRGHPLDLNSTEAGMHSHVVRTALEHSGVRNILQGFDNCGDPKTRHHSERTAWIVSAAAVRAEMAEQEAIIATMAALVHDAGKQIPKIQEAIQSPDRFEDNPSLRDIICGHVIETGRICREQGLSPNIAIIGENHHSFQTTRPAYGPLGPIRAVPEADNGFVPRTDRLTAMLAVADNYDALTVHPDESGRAYLKESRIGHAVALDVIDTLTVPEATKSLVTEVIKY